MIVEELAIPGVHRVTPERLGDARGFFARTACEDSFGAQGLVGRFTQSSISYNARRGTVRGMHFSAPPGEETKLVRCTAGAVHDVVLDLRRDSPTYRRSLAVALSAENRIALYIPVGIAHGFQTLRDDTELLYMIDTPFAAGTARGVRWNDPAFAIAWPEPVSVIAERDLAFTDWTA